MMENSLKFPDPRLNDDWKRRLSLAVRNRLLRLDDASRENGVFAALGVRPVRRKLPSFLERRPVSLFRRRRP